MKIFDVLLPAAVLGGAALLVLPASSPAFTTLGGTLDLRQRGFRVFNNFSDPTANANQTPDPRFPGATGAVLAIWKACVEWGSGPHGDGQGDPHQPWDLGSGGADFDAFFVGLANSPGGTNDNVFSQISGVNGGVLAFTELPISDGWRIRFYEAPWIWNDGPGMPVGGPDAKDIQGVATHEYGHALGLGHSVPGTTMQGSGGGNLVFMRSLAPDDIAGVQFLYGVRSAHKPRIEHYTILGGEVVLEGENFAAQGNAIWFTRGSGASTKDPVRVADLASTDGGTRLSAPIPLEAGPGDILLQVPGQGGDALSNAFPFDPQVSYCAPPKRYGQALPASTGALPTLEFFGVPSASADGVEIRTYGLPGNQPAVLFSGRGPAAKPFMGKTLLASPPFQRELIFQIDFFGDVELVLPVDPERIGTTRYFQLWFKDPGDASGIGLSDGLEITFCP